MKLFLEKTPIMHIGIKEDTSGFVWTHRLVDLLIPYAVLYTLLQITNVPWHDRYTVMGILGGFVFVTSAQMVGVYQNWRGRKLFTSSQIIIKAWLLTWAFLIIIAFFVKDADNFSRFNTVLWAVFTPLVFMGYRALTRLLFSKFRQTEINSKKVVIVGAGKVGKMLAQTLTETPWLGYQVIGFYDDNPKLKDTQAFDKPVLGTTSDIYSTSTQFDEVYICLPLRAEHKIKEILNSLTDSTAIVKFIPDLFSFDLLHAKWNDLKGIPVISVFDTPLNNSTARFIKRSEDIILSSLILFLISPIMLILAIGVKASSKGPVFYKQTRVGWNGENFSMLKFRSMPTDVEKGGVQWGSAQNKTNTKFGQFIRKTSLDELPQFLNVLKGDMSIVGPRPERDVFVEQFRKEIPRYMQKHMVKAGITGWAQVNGWRGDTCLNTRIEFDLDYINRWSLWLDIKIIVLTIFKGFINKNAI